MSKHEKRLENCIQRLVDFIQANEPVEVPDLEWWTRENEAKVKEHASKFLLQYIEQHMDCASAEHNVRLYLQAWSAQGIEVSSDLKLRINHLSRTRWRPEKLSRLDRLHEVKEQQFEAIHEKWPTMVEYMMSVEPAAFRTKLKEIVRAQGNYSTVAQSSYNEMAVLWNKKDAEIKRILLGTLAYTSVLRSTGMRSITALELSLDDFIVLGDGKDGVLVKRMERKSGSVRNVQKRVYCRVVPHKDPKLCPLLHIGRFVGLIANELPNEIFTYGFQKREGQDRVNFAKLPQRRYIAVLHAVAISCGLADGFGVKRLHMFRMMCENELASHGSSSLERMDHIGWTTTVQSRNYSALKHKSLNMRTPFLIAGRIAKDDDAHPVWDLLSKIPQNMSYWEKVAAFASALDGNGDPDFKELVENHVRHALKQRKEVLSPNELRRKIRMLEVELQQERTKRARMELISDSDTLSESSSSSDDPSVPVESAPRDAPTGTPMEKLQGLIEKLKLQSKATDLPLQCYAEYKTIQQLVNAINDGNSRSFGVAQSTPLGKKLVRVLLLCVLGKHGIVEKDCRSWFQYVDKQRQKHPLLCHVDTKSWLQFQKSME